MRRRTPRLGVYRNSHEFRHGSRRLEVRDRACSCVLCRLSATGGRGFVKNATEGVPLQSLHQTCCDLHEDVFQGALMAAEGGDAEPGANQVAEQIGFGVVVAVVSE